MLKKQLSKLLVQTKPFKQAPLVSANTAFQVAQKSFPAKFQQLKISTSHRATLVSPPSPPPPVGYSESQLLLDVYKSSKKSPTKVSLNALMSFWDVNKETPGWKEKLVHAASWLHGELQIRIARQVVELDRAPHGLNLMPSIIKVRNWYLESFKDLRLFPKICTFEQQVEFTKLIKRIYEKHSTTLAAMAKGMDELKKELSKGILLRIPEIDFADFVDIHKSLDLFYMARIGIRTIISHHVAVNEQLNDPRPDWIGVVCKNTSPAQVAQDAIDDATYMCQKNLRKVPQVKLLGRLDLQFPFIPSHIYYIMFELLKNSMKAVVEHHQKLHGPDFKDFPPVQVVIADEPSNEDVVIKISDVGGGIARSSIHKAFSYLFTTTSLMDTDVETVDFATEAPLAGLGFGLPLARLYARYCGGDLQLVSMENYGTDAYIHLNRSGNVQE